MCLLMGASEHVNGSVRAYCRFRAKRAKRLTSGIVPLDLGYLWSAARLRDASDATGRGERPTRPAPAEAGTSQVSSSEPIQKKTTWAQW
jgi:hypothetical protein